MLRISAIAFLLAIACAAVHAQTQPLITAARVARAEDQMTGPVYVTVGGKETKIANAGVDSWIIQGGRQVVYSGRDGSGGFENEGQSLYIYNARTARLRKIMSEYVFVDTVTEVTTSTGKTALLIKMSDVDWRFLLRGCRSIARVRFSTGSGPCCFRAKRRDRAGPLPGRRLGQDDVRTERKVTPYRRERYNLNSILKDV